MFEQYYGLSGRPFQLTPDPAFFFNSQVHQKAASYLLYGLGQGEGFIVLTGEVGAGKTMLLRHLLSKLKGDHYVAVVIETSQLGADDMLRMIAQAFAIPPSPDKAARLGAIQDFLASNHRQGRRCLLLVDEAQNLTMAALEELRMLSNFQLDGRSLMQSFLVGQPQFCKTIAHVDLEQLRQRVIASFHLGPMSASETETYVDHRLRTAGWHDNPVFDADCFPALYRHSAGIPRRINLLMSRLLLFGCLEQKDRISAIMVDEVAGGLNAELNPPPGLSRPQHDCAGADLTGQVQRLSEGFSRHDVALKQTLGLFAQIVACI